MKKTSKRLDYFLTEFLPPIVLSIIAVVVFIVIKVAKLSFASAEQALLFAAITWIPAFIFIISGFKFRLPPVLKIGVYTFVTLSNLVATTFNLYCFVPFFDTILHTLFGYSFGFLFIYLLLYVKDYDNISLFTKTLFFFLAAAAVGTLWEVCEYVVDIISKSNSQHEIETGLLDTMSDTFCNLCGASVFVFHFLIDNKFCKGKFFNFIRKNVSTYLITESKKDEDGKAISSEDKTE